MEKVERIKWVDGIKGLACVLILCHHYFIWKAPAIYFGSLYPSCWNGIDIWLSQSVLSFLINGNFFVHLFVLITGYVVAFQVKKMQDTKDKLLLFNVKRYIKLIIPIFIYVFVIWAIQIIPYIGLKCNYNFFDIIKSCFFKICFVEDRKVGAHFWMLNYVFTGGCAVSLVAASSWYFDNRKMSGIFLGSAIIILLQRTTGAILYATCCSGALLYFLIEELNNYEFKYKTIIFSLILLLSIFIGAYPTGVVPDNYYRFLTFSVNNELVAFFWHFVGVILFFISVSQLNFLKKFFELPVIQIMAKYSFTFFIVHLKAMEYLRIIFNKIIQTNNDIHILLTIIFLLLSIGFTFLCAFIFQNLIVKPIYKVVDAFFSAKLTTHFS